MHSGAKFLLVLHTFCFLLQLAADSFISEQFSVQAGALSTAHIYHLHQYWRLVTCIFLHADVVHFASNMFGLYILSPFVEQFLGRKIFVLSYLLYGIFSSFFVFFLTLNGYMRNTYTLGASGAILGLVGATAAILIYVWSKKGDIRILKQLKSVAIIIIIQSIFDLSMPNISMAAHMGGVLGGLVITPIVIYIVVRLRRPVS